jgi:HK97 family phage prohead protease
MDRLGRAYSFIEIKAVDEDKRILEGVATTPTPDRMQDIVNPLGAQFTLPIPFLWQHRHDEPIGHVIDADVKKTGIRFKAQIEQTGEPGRLKERLDEAWQSLKLKLVRATSIGFAPLKWSFLENGGGIEYEEWDWLELSAVTIPAQPEAVITAVKQFDRIYREAAGVPEFEIPVAPKDRAASGAYAPVVKMGVTARDGAPFILKKIHPPV